MMHPNYAYSLERARRVTGRVLDFGCGSGETIRAGRAMGIEIYGADVFYDPAASALTKVADLLGTWVFRIEDGRLPFPDGHFETVVSNQVLEHVENLEEVLREIRRVLRPGGRFIALFPTKEVLRENHCGVPIAHWLVGRPLLFRAYMGIFYTVGLGLFRAGRTRRQWIRHYEEFLTHHTHYRSMSAVNDTYRRAGFHPVAAESDYIRFRWGRMALPVFAYRLLSGVVIEAQAI